MISNQVIFVAIVAGTATIFSIAMIYFFIAKKTRKIIETTERITREEHRRTRDAVERSRKLLEKRIKEYEDEVEIGAQ